MAIVKNRQRKAVYCVLNCRVLFTGSDTPGYCTVRYRYLSDILLYVGNLVCGLWVSFKILYFWPVSCEVRVRSVPVFYVWYLWISGFLLHPVLLLHVKVRYPGTICLQKIKNHGLFIDITFISRVFSLEGKITEETSLFRSVIAFIKKCTTWYCTLTFYFLLLLPYWRYRT